jgi:hypothetical protein
MSATQVIILSVGLFLASLSALVYIIRRFKTRWFRCDECGIYFSTSGCWSSQAPEQFQDGLLCDICLNESIEREQKKS